MLSYKLLEAVWMFYLRSSYIQKALVQPLIDDTSGQIVAQFAIGYELLPLIVKHSPAIALEKSSFWHEKSIWMEIYSREAQPGRCSDTLSARRTGSTPSLAYWARLFATNGQRLANGFTPWSWTAKVYYTASALPKTYWEQIKITPPSLPSLTRLVFVCIASDVYNPLLGRHT